MVRVQSSVLWSKLARSLVPTGHLAANRAASAGRAELQASLEILLNYIRDLVGALMDVKPSNSGFYHSGWELLAKPMFQNMSLYVSDKKTRSCADNPRRHNRLVSRRACGRYEKD